jgi:hypothetical protein
MVGTGAADASARAELEPRKSVSNNGSFDSLMKRTLPVRMPHNRTARQAKASEANTLGDQAATVGSDRTWAPGSPAGAGAMREWLPELTIVARAASFSSR